MSAVLLDAEDMRRTLGRMAHEILEANQGAEDLVVVYFTQLIPARSIDDFGKLRALVYSALTDR